MWILITAWIGINNIVYQYKETCDLAVENLKKIEVVATCIPKGIPNNE